MSSNEKRKEVLRELKKLSQSSPLSINELRVILALERIIARVEVKKELKDKLIFKGGFVLLKTLLSNRFTRDLDALAHEIDKENVVPLIN